MRTPNFVSKREEREDFYVEEMTDFALNKEFKSFGLKVLKELLDALNKTTRNEAKFALLLKDPKSGDYIEISYFKSEIDANYAKRKLPKITRLAFKDQYSFSVESIKSIDASA